MKNFTFHNDDGSKKSDFFRDRNQYWPINIGDDTDVFVDKTREKKRVLGKNFRIFSIPELVSTYIDPLIKIGKIEIPIYYSNYSLKMIVDFNQRNFLYKLRHMDVTKEGNARINTAFKTISDISKKYIDYLTSIIRKKL